MVYWSDEEAKVSLSASNGSIDVYYIPKKEVNNPKGTELRARFFKDNVFYFSEVSLIELIINPITRFIIESLQSFSNLTEEMSLLLFTLQAYNAEGKEFLEPPKETSKFKVKNVILERKKITKDLYASHICICISNKTVRCVCI